MMHTLHAALFGRMPLFWLGLAFVAGVYVLLNPATIPVFLFSACFCFFLLSIRHICFLIVAFIAGLCWSKATIQYPSIGSTCFCSALVEVTNIVQYQLHKKTMWRCDLWIDSLKDSEGKEIARGVRAMLFHKDPCPLTASGVFLVQAVVEHKTPFCLMLTHPKKITVVQKGGVSLVGIRNEVRDRLTKALSSVCHDEEANMLLGTMCFSMPCSQDVRRLIHKVGLDHILGVSGVHFGQLAFIVALAAGFLNRWAFSCVTWIFLTLFFLMVGPQPSVFRAWIASTLCVGQRLFGRQSSGLNSLGVGLLVLAIYDPGTLTTLSLQLSFLATCALLTWYPTVFKILEKCIPRHSPKELWNFPIVDQFLAFILNIVRTSFALVFSIALMMIPYQLAYLPDLPLMGLLANLFLPLFFDIALLGTFFVLGVYVLIPGLGVWLGVLLERYVQFLMNVVRDMPIPLCSLVQNCHVSELFASFYVAFLMLVGVFLRIRAEYVKDEVSPAFLKAI